MEKNLFMIDEQRMAARERQAAEEPPAVAARPSALGDDYAVIPLAGLVAVSKRWQVLRRVLEQEWERLKGEQAAILSRPAGEMPPMVRWYANLKPSVEGEAFEFDGKRGRRATWQGAYELPDAASVLEREKKLRADKRRNGDVVVDELGQILDQGEFRPMTPAEKRKYHMYPSLRERRAQRRMELEEKQRLLKRG